MIQTVEFKVGKVALVGRPNVGKSTLLNALLGHKVAIVSDKPQTTRSQIVAFFEDERGQIFFLDTPGYYEARKAATHYNHLIQMSINEADLIVYVVDKTRNWGEEDERVWNMVSGSGKDVILAINKIDKKRPDFSDAYIDLLKEEVKAIIPVSAERGAHVIGLRNLLFDNLPTGTRNPMVDSFVTPLLSQSSKEYIAELIREKIYIYMSQEVPYQVTPRVTSIEEIEEKNELRIKGEIIVPVTRYKPMLIGKNGSKIKQISQAVKKELSVGTGKTVNVRLMVVVE